MTSRNAQRVFFRPYLVMLVMGFLFAASPSCPAQDLQKVSTYLAEELLDKLRYVKDGNELRIFPALFFYEDTTKTQFGWSLNNSLRDRLRGLISANPKRFGHIRIIAADKEELYTDEYSYKFLVTPSSAEENNALQERLKGSVPHYFITGKYELSADQLIIKSLRLRGNPYVKLSGTKDIEVLTEPYTVTTKADIMAKWVDMSKPLGATSASYTSQFLDFLFEKKKKQNRNTAANYGISFLTKNELGQYVASNQLYRQRDYKVQVRLSELATNTYIHLLQFERKRADAPVEVFPIYPLVNSEQQKPFEAPNNLTFPLGGEMEVESSTPDIIHFILIACNEPLPTEVRSTLGGEDGSFTPRLLERACQDLLYHLKTLSPDSYVLLHKEVKVENP